MAQARCATEFSKTVERWGAAKIEAMAIELTAQLYPFCNRLCEFGAVDLAFVMHRDQTIEELIVTCDDKDALEN